MIVCECGKCSHLNFLIDWYKCSINCNYYHEMFSDTFIVYYRLNDGIIDFVYHIDEIEKYIFDIKQNKFSDEKLITKKSSEEEWDLNKAINFLKKISENLIFE